MTTITDQKVLNGILADDVSIHRAVASAISQLKANTDLMADIAAYLFTEVKDIDSSVDQGYIDNVTARFQEQLVPLMTQVLPKLQAIEACGDAVNGDANLQTMIDTYLLDPSTFTNRYK